MSLFDPNSIQKNQKEKIEKQKNYEQIEKWCLEFVNEQNKEAVTANQKTDRVVVDMTQCVLSVQEVSCGDPNCSPFDTIITFAFQS